MNWKNISGAPYDWKKTGEPERPYIHKYHEALVLKMFMSIPDNKGGSIVGCTFAQALERIKGLDKFTQGVPKIIYLVGWQYDGHDDRYPDWSEVNERLKRTEDATALESLKWLMKEAKAYNTTVSLHINMTDAYPISPLWETYIANDLISKRWGGRLRKTGKWNGRMAYQINYTHEWESGYAVKRIDRLVEMLNLSEQGTVHIDAFFCRSSRGHGISTAQEQAYRRKYIRYWRELGIDVTSEFVYEETGSTDLIGLMPMVWWINQSEQDYLERPAGLFVGGKPNKDYKKFRKNLDSMFGKSIHGEDFWMDGSSEKKEDHRWRERFMDRYFLDSLPFFYLNSLNRLSVDGKGSDKRAVYTQGIVSYAKKHLITDGSWVLKEGKDVLVPNIHMEGRNLVAYSRSGYDDRFMMLPKDWKNVKSVSLSEMTINGIESEAKTRAIKDNRIVLSLKAGQALLIRPMEGDEK